MHHLPKMLENAAQRKQFIEQITSFCTTLKETCNAQAVDIYWLFNQEWYHAEKQKPPLQTLKSYLAHHQILTPKAIQDEQENHVTIVPIFIHGKHVGFIICTQSNHDSVTELLNPAAHLLAIILEKEQQNITLKEQYYAVIRGMIAIIESLDPYLRDHSKNVANYALLLAQELGVDADQTASIYYAALFHDIGKIGIPIELLQKPDSLTPTEYNIIKQHPHQGACILEQFSMFSEMVPMVRHHHEMWSGGGYPDGLIGTAIPFGARLIAVVDAYDALTTNRVYRKAQGEKTALEIIQKNTPQQFDPAIVQAFMGIAHNL